MTQNRPRDAKLVGLLLSALEVDEYEENTILMLLQFMQTYTRQILDEVCIYIPPVIPIRPVCSVSMPDELPEASRYPTLS